MNTSPSPRRNRAPVRVGLAVAAAFVALASLAGCAGPDVLVTETVIVPPASPSASADADPADPANPANPAPDTGAASVVVTQGPVAPECTNSVCHYVHVSWQNLEPGLHVTQCVTDHGDIAAWSESTYNYPTADGERDLGCFLGYAGSHVWVVLDGTLESNHADWG